MRFNLIWYIPLFVMVAVFVVVPTARAEYGIAQILFRRWSWGAFFSPSAYVFFASALASLVVPFQMLLFVRGFFEPEWEPAYRRRYFWTLCTVFAIVAVLFLLQVVMWGSFPLEVDTHRYVRLRLIPFLPWPERPFLVYE
jgi:hypothetical protein